MQCPSFIPVPTLLSTLLFITTTTTAVFTSLHCYFITATSIKLLLLINRLRARLLSGAAELTTHLLRLISILWLPLCRINKLGFTSLEDCGDPQYCVESINWVLSLMLKLKVEMKKKMLLIKKKLKRNLRSLIKMQNIPRRISLPGNMVVRENLGYKNQCLFLIRNSTQRKENTITSSVSG